MIIICDASPLVALATCDCLYLLDKLFCEVYVTPEVFKEVTVTGTPFATVLATYLIDKVYLQKIPQDSNTHTLEKTLDLGELSAFSLYHHLNADYVLIDEKLGRHYANEQNIRILGSLGILLLGKKFGHIQQIRPFIDELRRSPIFIGEALIAHTLNLANES